MHGQQLSLSDFQIQIVEERLVSPAGAKEPSTIPFGAMSYGPLFQRQHTFNIVTRERREKDRARAHPKSIYEAVRNSKIKAATRPAVDTNFWLSKTSKVGVTRHSTFTRITHI